MTSSVKFENHGLSYIFLSSDHLLFLFDSRTSDPLVKVNSTYSLTASTLLHRLVLLSLLYLPNVRTIQSWKVAPARKFKFTTAARELLTSEQYLKNFWSANTSNNEKKQLKYIYLQIPGKPWVTEDNLKYRAALSATMNCLEDKCDTTGRNS